MPRTRWKNRQTISSYEANKSIGQTVKLESGYVKQKSNLEEKSIREKKQNRTEQNINTSYTYIRYIENITITPTIYNEFMTHMLSIILCLILKQMKPWKL